jgi:hypothetical protein
MTLESERRLLSLVADAQEQARQQYPELAEAVESAVAELTTAFSAVALDARFHAVVQFYREYGRKLDWVLNPFPVVGSIGMVTSLAQALLKEYWQAMGRPCFDRSSFPVLAPGTTVRLRRGELQTREIFHDKTMRVGWSSSKGIWLVDETTVADVDGVPVYWLEREDRSESTLARQTAMLTG